MKEINMKINRSSKTKSEEIIDLLYCKELSYVAVELNNGENYTQYFSNEIEKKYYQEVVFYSESVFLEKRNLEINNLENFQNYKQTTNLHRDCLYTSSVGFNVLWKDHLPKSFFKKMDELLLELVTLEDSYFLLLNKKLISILNVIKGKYENSPIIYVGWVWICESIKGDLRQEVRCKIHNLINSYNLPVAASVYWRNSRSIEFHQNLGLKPICIKFTKLY